MKTVVMGAGDLIVGLLGQLAGRWEVTVVEQDPERLARVAEAAPVETWLASGNLRDSLELAGLPKASVLLAASVDDNLNLEACRIARQLGVPSVAVAAAPESLEDFRRIGSPAISVDRLIARRLVTTLEPQRLLSAGLAGERLEVIDMRMVSRSPMCGRPLRSLDLKGWLVVGVLRDDRLEVPHGDTILQSGDVVTLVGEEAARSEVIAAFTSGIPRFPTDYGPRVAVALDLEADLAGPVAEAAHLATHSAAHGLAVVHRRAGGDGPRGELLERAREMMPGLPLEAIPVDGDPQAALQQGLPAAEAGLLVVPAPAGPAGRQRRQVQDLLGMVTHQRVPVLVSRRTFPYRRVLAPARDTPTARAAGEAAIEIAAHSGAVLVGLAVIPPAFIAADDALDRAIRAAGRLQIEAAAHGVDVQREIEQGNEVRLFGRLSDEQTLVALGSRWRPRLFGPGIAAHLVRRLSSSVLVVPVRR